MLLVGVRLCALWCPCWSSRTHDVDDLSGLWLWLWGFVSPKWERARRLHV